jgi:putative membrane protein
MLVRPKVFNTQAFLESSCCFLFSSLTVYLVTSGQYLVYVTPRMKPYLYFTAAVMLVWSYMGIRRLLTPRNKARSAHCFVLVIPILLLLLPHSPLGASDLSYSLARGGLAQSRDDIAAPADDVQELTLPSEEYDGFADPSDLSAALSGMDTSAKTITINDGEFYPWLEEMFMNPDKYAGYTVKMTGFVLKDPELLPDEFVPARLIMSCCVADLLPYGMICKYEKMEELRNDSWVTVEGVIRITEENGYREPQAQITRVAPAAKVEGYIYPF